MERYGNLDLISWYEIRELEGKNYPDRLKYENGSISFTVEADRYTVFLFHAERKPECKEGLKNIPFWDWEEQLFMMEGIFHKGERIEVKL